MIIGVDEYRRTLSAGDGGVLQNSTVNSNGGLDVYEPMSSYMPDGTLREHNGGIASNIIVNAGTRNIELGGTTLNITVYGRGLSTYLE